MLGQVFLGRNLEDVERDLRAAGWSDALGTARTFVKYVLKARRFDEYPPLKEELDVADLELTRLSMPKVQID